MKLPEQFREMATTDVCCSKPENLLAGKDYDGGIIDGAWTCKVCGRNWFGNGKDELCNHPLRTMTEFGEAFFWAMDDVMREGKHLELQIVLGRMAFKDRSGLERMLAT